MPTRRTSRTVARTLVVVLAVAALGGCVASQKAQYVRHLNATVRPDPAGAGVSVGALADE